MKPTHILSNGVLDLLADRAALVAEVARLEFDAGMRQIAAAVYLDDLHAAEAQVAAMRPLVERIARGDSHEFYVSIFGDTCCIGCNATASTHIDFPHDDDCTVLAARALVATWQTPAAPRLTGRERIQALRDAQATPPTGEITAIMVSRDSELTEPPVAPTPLPTRYVRTEDGGIESAPGGLLYTADCNFTEAEWVALLALLNEGYDGLTWEEIEPLVVERIEATTAPTPDVEAGK